MKKNMNIKEIRSKGYEALARSLGSDGMIRFLQELDPGKDDYSKNRHRDIDKLSVDDICSDIMKK